MTLTSFHSSIAVDPSPHYNSRGSLAIDGTVIHFTKAGRALSSINWFQDPTSKVSAHFVIDREGQSTQLVDLDKAAWHAGGTKFTHPDQNTNKYTIGIELANWGPLVQKAGAFYGKIRNNMFDYEGLPPKEAQLIFPDDHVSCFWEPYPEEQIEGLVWLLSELGSSGYMDAVNNLVGHEEIAQPLGKKLDPGPLFPWNRFGRINIPVGRSLVQ